MRLHSFKQIDLFNFPLKFDLFIAASGYEQRASFISNNGINAEKKIVLAFEDNKEHSNRIINDAFFEKKGFKFIPIKGNDNQIINYLLDDFINHSTSQNINILIDYSSMTRVIYGGILKYFRMLDKSDIKIKLYFSYSIAEYVAPPEIEPETFNFYPINSYCNLSLPTKATALIAGLGYEKKRVFGLREYFDAEALYLFYTDKSPYTDIVKIKNKEVITSVSENNLFPYILSDMLYTKMLLYDLCETLNEKFRIVIAPCGPKPFTLLCFITSLSISNVDIWRISAGDDDNDAIMNRKPTGDTISIELVFN